MSENLALWNRVRTPDPAFTKGFSKGGGFKGTATNVSYLIRLATEQWGPMGGKWGVEIVKEDYIDGAPLLGTDGDVIGHEMIHVIQIKLRHPDGEVPGIGQTTFVGKNKNGVFTDEEAPKKSLTDALSKALSWLGFAADIHMGLWDDNKYVADVRREFEEREHSEKVALVTGEQAQAISAAIEAAGADTSMLLEWVSEKSGLAVGAVSGIPAQAFEAVMRALSKKAKGVPV